GLQLDTSLSAFEVAAQGGGIALGRSSLAARERASGRLIAPLGLEVPIDEAFYLIHTTSPMHPDAALFTDWLLSAARKAG
ncbi:MAG: LysR family transcriptional regulator, partial [Paracoccaceae bacterium]|nr:LysR family transcriptional regulator [Paracoccaceae bacterium]